SFLRSHREARPARPIAPDAFPAHTYHRRSTAAPRAHCGARRCAASTPNTRHRRCSRRIPVSDSCVPTRRLETAFATQPVSVAAFELRIVRPQTRGRRRWPRIGWTGGMGGTHGTGGTGGMGGRGLAGRDFLQDLDCCLSLPFFRSCASFLQLQRGPTTHPEL